MVVSCHATASTPYIHSGSGVRLTSLGCPTKISVDLKTQFPVSVGVAKPNSHLVFRTQVHNSIQSRTSDSEPPGRSITMMSKGTPIVPLRVPGQRYVQYRDLWSALYNERIIFIGHYINDDFSSSILSMILYLDSVGSEPLLFGINSPGGDVLPTLTIYDAMQSLQSPVGTRCMGAAVHLAGFLLAAGDKGNRAAMPMSRIVLQAPSGYAQGQADNVHNEANELTRIRDYLFNQLATKTGQPIEKIYKDLKWPKRFTADEALEYGLIDRIARRKDASSDGVANTS